MIQGKKIISPVLNLLAAVVAAAVCSGTASAQGTKGLTLQGTVYNRETRKPVEFGTVIVLEARKKVYTDTRGFYSIIIPESGTYTVIIKSEGLMTLKLRVAVNEDMVRNFQLGSMRVKGKGLTVTGKRDFQKVSRHTMSKEQMKEVPSSFGDSLSALTSLPGVIRTSGLFGPIVIRGGDNNGIYYLIDDIPVHSPYHYGGLHSIINSNLIDEIDLFSSAFPAEFGSATSSIISINTVDDVKDFGGYTDLSILSAAALIQTPLIINKEGKTTLASPLYPVEKEEKNLGYVIVSGRLGYIDWFVLPLIELLTGEEISLVPRYWDYQAKAKFYLNSNNSLTFLFMGSSDYFKLVNNDPDYGSGEDPLTTGLRVNTDQMWNGQGLYYTYHPSDKFRNRITFYSSLKNSYTYINFPAGGVNLALKDIHIDSRPYIFGLKDKFKVTAVKNYLEIRGGAEYDLYYFKADGKTVNISGNGFTFDISEDDTFTPIFLDEKIFNHKIGGFIETKITYKGLTFLPGFRTDYLKRSGEMTWDPRCLISYEFKSGTTISAAGGKYSYFFQTNPVYFDGFPQLSKAGRELKSEWAIHRVVGIEQVIDLFKIKAEGFFNDFYDLAQRYLHVGPDGKLRETMSTGRIQAYGAELMLQVDRKEGEDGIFGWVSYTYTRSRFKSGLPTYNIGNPYGQVGDPWGSTWVSYQHEQNHSLKLIAGYVLGRNTFSCRFQLFSSNPYTPIAGGREDLDYATANPGLHRYYPVFGKPYSRYFPVYHWLDIRYSFTTNYSWGHVSWYLEVVNVYNNRPIVFESWDYRYPYVPHRNPKKKSFSDTIAFIPNFGVEVKF